ncbi:AraC family transcriptional regulator [Stutzerimonas zhaodongensis]|jgi:AraC-like DNA-binding protein|uniref:AraC family transcriptional regulator n=1 Tax=Stutzerimonas zhaodongensis TaxID=1176257 RepID=A0A365PXC4_9GAMM|nr:AraC family transcriptional regulator [Stutzerimonas zhaodongensis]QWV17826.1 AraC family transcriptional regulator [Stutzerimonas zhaodongensis]RBA60474.1 AraC family transcriptional regulator [Stutzerimonas zhaodongensis]
MNRLSTEGDWLERAAPSTKMERIEAYFRGHGYTPHRHDTYAIGRTLAGVQSFHYRQSMRHSLPGGTIVLHPDEIHDGEAGTNAGFRYRILYIEPSLIQDVLGGEPLPFIVGGLSHDPRLLAATSRLLHSLDTALDPLEEDDAIYDLAQALKVAGGKPHGRKAVDYVAAERARTFIHDALDQSITLDDLVQASGRDRWSLSRDFRALYGTSPYRYITQRRLAEARYRLLAGQSLTDAALESGFFDQSHMTRLFTQAFGISPARWLRMLTSR